MLEQPEDRNTDGRATSAVQRRLQVVPPASNLGLCINGP